VTSPGESIDPKKSANDTELRELLATIAERVKRRDLDGLLGQVERVVELGCKREDLLRLRSRLYQILASQIEKTLGIAIPDLEQCRYLDLSFEKINPAGLLHLKELKQLTSLDLSLNHLTDAGVVHLKELKQLTKLDLRWNQLTDAGESDLRKHLPGTFL